LQQQNVGFELAVEVAPSSGAVLEVHVLTEKPMFSMLVTA
jgi:hypothetical protein